MTDSTKSATTRSSPSRFRAFFRRVTDDTSTGSPPHTATCARCFTLPWAVRHQRGGAGHAQHRHVVIRPERQRPAPGPSAPAPPRSQPTLTAPAVDPGTRASRGRCRAPPPPVPCVSAPGTTNKVRQCLRAAAGHHQHGHGRAPMNLGYEIGKRGRCHMELGDPVRSRRAPAGYGSPRGRNPALAAPRPYSPPPGAPAARIAPAWPHRFTLLPMSRVVPRSGWYISRGSPRCLTWGSSKTSSAA